MNCEIWRAIRTDSVMRYVHRAGARQAVRNLNSDETSVKRAGKVHYEHVHNVWSGGFEEQTAAGRQ